MPDKTGLFANYLAGHGLRRPSSSGLLSDALAGLTFAVVNVPQSMAHALLATVNPIFGIYTLMCAVPVGALVTSSVFMNVSTTSALSVATAAGLSTVPPEQRAAALVALVLMVGVIQLAMGLLKLGYIVRFVSNAVMTGFLNGVACLIILGQLDDLTGYASAYSSQVVQALDLLVHLHKVNPHDTFFGLITLLLIVGLLFSKARKFAFVGAISAATMLLWLLGWDAAGTVGDMAGIPRALPAFVLPQPMMMLTMFLPAISIATVGLIQGAGVSQSYPNPDGKYPNVSRDFAGEGIANMVTAFFRGLPAGGSISGTVLVKSAGAVSRRANLVAGIFVAAIVLVAAPVAEAVPLSALAALLIVAGARALRIRQARTVLNTGPVPATIMMLTFVLVLLVPLHYAILFGIGLSILLHVFQQTHRVAVKELIPVPGELPQEGPAPRELPSDAVTVLNIYGSLFFAAARNIEESLPSPERAHRPVVILILRGHEEVGSTFITVLRRFAGKLHASDGTLMLAGTSARVMDQLAKTGTLAAIGEDNVFPATSRIGEALERALTAANTRLEP